ncbi:MAG: hypothetical protein QXR34_05650 [Saccharolobus sp.]
MNKYAIDISPCRLITRLIDYVSKNNWNINLDYINGKTKVNILTLNSQFEFFIINEEDGKTVLVHNEEVKDLIQQLLDPIMNNILL